MCLCDKLKRCSVSISKVAAVRLSYDRGKVTRKALCCSYKISMLFSVGHWQCQAHRAKVTFGCFLSYTRHLRLPGPEQDCGTTARLGHFECCIATTVFVQHGLGVHASSGERWAVATTCALCTSATYSAHKRLHAPGNASQRSGTPVLHNAHNPMHCSLLSTPHAADKTAMHSSCTCALALRPAPCIVLRPAFAITNAASLLAWPPQACAAALRTAAVAAVP